jgi:hypothetical protein
MNKQLEDELLEEKLVNVAKKLIEENKSIDLEIGAFINTNFWNFLDN